MAAAAVLQQQRADVDLVGAVEDRLADGDLDAWVANYDQPNSIWFNDGAGRFTDSGQTLGAARSNGVALGDLDGDGLVDASDLGLLIAFWGGCP